MKFILLFLLTACSHRPVYAPQAPDAGGGIVSRGGVVYPIPAQNPVLKMKLVSMGINKDHMLHVRLYFLQKQKNREAFMIPTEQTVSLNETTAPIAPSKIYANQNARPKIDIAANDRSLVELLFPLPVGGDKFPFIKLNWKIHYGSHVEAQTEIFQIEDKYSQHRQGDNSADGDFPIEEPWLIPVDSMWIGPDYLWW